jgi:hypothetical protein
MLLIYFLHNIGPDEHFSPDCLFLTRERRMVIRFDCDVALSLVLGVDACTHELSVSNGPNCLDGYIV